MKGSKKAQFFKTFKLQKGMFPMGFESYSQYDFTNGTILSNESPRNFPIEKSHQMSQPNLDQVLFQRRILSNRKVSVFKRNENSLPPHNKEFDPDDQKCNDTVKILYKTLFSSDEGSPQEARLQLPIVADSELRLKRRLKITRGVGSRHDVKRTTRDVCLQSGELEIKPQNPSMLQNIDNDFMRTSLKSRNSRGSQAVINYTGAPHGSKDISEFTVDQHIMQVIPLKLKQDTQAVPQPEDGRLLFKTHKGSQFQQNSFKYNC